MRKLLFFAALALSAAGCKSATTDYPGFSYYVWVNGSDHTVTLSIPDVYFYDPDDPQSGIYGLEAEMSPGETCTAIYSGMMTTIPPSFFPPVSVLFDGAYGVEFSRNYNDGAGSTALPSGYDVRYNLVFEENYDAKSVRSPEGCSRCSGRRWTYTFTDADYRAAVEYGHE